MGAGGIMPHPTTPEEEREIEKFDRALRPDPHGIRLNLKDEPKSSVKTQTKLPLKG